MNAAERLRTIESLYRAARARPPEERAAFLADACAGDETLRVQIESLLAQPDSTVGRLVTPALAVVAQTATDSGPASLIGRRLGVYQMLALLGVGGMGEVYRARDTRLGRDVAIKVLPQTVTADPERLARFEREARVLAALNHPNIGTIYGVEEFDAPSGSGLPIAARSSWSWSRVKRSPSGFGRPRSVVDHARPAGGRRNRGQA